MKHVKLGVPFNMEGDPICSPYYQSSATPYKDHNTWVPIYCHFFFLLTKSIYMVVFLEIPNPTL